VLLLGYLFLGIYYNLSIWFKITDKTKYSLYITLIGAAITVLVIFTLIPILGFMGAALSTLLSYMTMAIICYAIGQNFYPVPYRANRGMFYLATSFLLGYAGFAIELSHPLLEFPLQNAFLLAYALIIALMEKKELSLILLSIFVKKWPCK